MKEFTRLLSNCQQIILDSNAQDFKVSEIQIFKTLLTLNSSKSMGPDGISGRDVLKENAKGGLPQSWKHADVVRIPIKEQVRDVTATSAHFIFKTTLLLYHL